LYAYKHKAWKAFEQAAQQGCCLAEHQLAFGYEQADDKQLAMPWHVCAASQGHPGPLYALYMYDKQAA
jgi:hypothetical protein